MFYPRGCAAPLREIAAIATLERFVVYCSLELIISGRAPGRGPEGTGNCTHGDKLEKEEAASAFEAVRAVLIDLSSEAASCSLRSGPAKHPSPDQVNSPRRALADGVDMGP